MKRLINDISNIPEVSLIEKSEDKAHFYVKLQLETKVKVKRYIYILDNVVRVRIPRNYPNELPKVWEETPKEISKYEHLNGDYSFCLGTNQEIRMRLKTANYSIAKYISFIIDYIGIYKYYRAFKKYPYGDRSHYKKGVIESYMDYFKVEKESQVINLLRIKKVNNKIKNLICMCGSGKKFKKCHLPSIKRVLNDANLREQYEADSRYILGGMNE